MQVKNFIFHHAAQPQCQLQFLILQTLITLHASFFFPYIFCIKNIFSAVNIYFPLAFKDQVFRDCYLGEQGMAKW